jgi:hypothetical protein
MTAIECRIHVCAMGYQGLHTRPDVREMTWPIRCNVEQSSFTALTADPDLRQVRVLTQKPIQGTDVSHADCLDAFRCSFHRHMITATRQPGGQLQKKV